MFTIKYVNQDDTFSYSALSPDCKEIRFGEDYSSKVKAISFLKKNILNDGEVPEKYKSIHIYECSQGFTKTSKNYYNKNYKN